MVASALPPQLISLIHHVELNELGWFDNANKRFILTAIWLAGKSLTPKEVSDDLRNLFSINLDMTSVKCHADALCSSGILICLPDGRLKLSEKSLSDFAKDLEMLYHTESQVKARFTHFINEHCGSLDAEDTWKRFTEHFLFSFIREMGARTYELLSGTTLKVDRTTTLAHFLQRYPAEARIPLQAALVAFLDPKDLALRAYILRHLNAFLLIEASSLPEETLKILANLTERTPSFTIFIDTNLLFSILQLHDNPADTAAVVLVELIKQLPSNVSVKLYISPHSCPN